MTISWHADESPIKAGLPAFDMCADQTGPGSYPDRPGLTGSTTLTEDVADSLPATGLPPAGTSSDALTSSPTGLGFKVTEAVFFDGNTALYIPGSAAISSSSSTALSLSFWVESYDPILQGRAWQDDALDNWVDSGGVSYFYHPQLRSAEATPSAASILAQYNAAVPGTTNAPANAYVYGRSTTMHTQYSYNSSILTGIDNDKLGVLSDAGTTVTNTWYQVRFNNPRAKQGGCLFCGPYNSSTQAHIAAWIQGHSGNYSDELLVVDDGTHDNEDGMVAPTAPGTVWAHVMLSFHVVGGKLKGTCAINDQVIHSGLDLGTAATFLTNATGSAWAIGGQLPGEFSTSGDGSIDYSPFPTAGNGFKGCVAELWISKTYIDFSAQANRELFHSSETFNTLGNLHPVDLGKNGQLPTGSKPLIYCSGIGTTTAGPVHMFQVNRATGKKLSLFGDLILCQEPPPGSDTL